MSARPSHRRGAALAALVAAGAWAWLAAPEAAFAAPRPAAAGPAASAAPGPGAPVPARPVAPRPRPAASAEPTLAELLAGLDQAYPPVVAAAADLRAAEAALLAAEGAFDPSWRTRAGVTPAGGYRNGQLDSGIEQATTLWGAVLSGGYRLGAGEFATYDGKLATNDAGELRAGIAIPLLRNGPIDRRRAELARGEAGVVAAAAGVDLARLDAARLVAGRYWDWVAAGERLRVARGLLAVAERRDGDLAAAIKAGQLPALERLDNERALHQRRGALAAAVRGLEAAAIELSLYWRDAAGEPRPLAGPPRAALPAARPPGPDLRRADEARARVQRPEPRRLLAQRRQAAVERDWAENQLATGLDFSVGVSQDLGAGDPRKALPEVVGGVLLDVPLVARAPRGRLAQAEAAIARLDVLARFAADRAAADVRDAASSVAAATARLAAAEREAAVARRLEAAERERLALGEGTLFMINLREQATFEASLRAIEARADVQKAYVAYATAAGRLPD